MRGILSARRIVAANVKFLTSDYGAMPSRWCIDRCSVVCYDCLPASPRRPVEIIASGSLRIGQNVASRINSIERNGGETEPVPQPKSKESHQSWGPASVSPLTCSNVCYFACFRLIERAPEGLETLPANSSEANLLLNSATSAAKMYRLFAIKCVRSHPRFS